MAIKKSIPAPTSARTPQSPTTARPTSTTSHLPNREQWLQSAIRYLRRTFSAQTNLTLPPTVHVSVGFPSTRALSSSKRRIGECWHAQASSDGHPHVFISPLLHDGVEVLSTLVHELIHAAGIKSRKANFKTPAIALGLVGKMTATTPGPELTESLKQLLTKLGGYPHSGLTASDRPTKKQTTRLLKAACSNDDCGAIIRLTQKVIDTPGLPICACGGEFELD